MAGKPLIRFMGILLVMGVLTYTSTYFRLTSHSVHWAGMVEDEYAEPEIMDQNTEFPEIVIDVPEPRGDSAAEKAATTVAPDLRDPKQNDPDSAESGHRAEVAEERSDPERTDGVGQSRATEGAAPMLVNDDALIRELPPSTLDYSDIRNSSSAAQFPRASFSRAQPRRNASQRMNVLFLVVDDLRPQLNSYNNFRNLFPDDVFRMHTPNLDALSRRSLLLTRAYVQYSSCNPSRASYMTSRRPDTTKVWNLKSFWRRSSGSFTTIPQFFGERGYRTTGMGKIYHPGQGGGFNDPESWNDGYYIPPHGGYWNSRNTTSGFWRAVGREERRATPLPDEELVINAVNRLRRYAPKALSGEEPFFLAVGFLKPHLPIVFPEEFLELYPLDELSMPNNPFLPKNFPEAALMPPAEVTQCSDVNLTASWRANLRFPDRMTRLLRRAYFAGVSYVDFLIGIVLSELESLGLADSTMVSFLGDHGWHLGELGYWGKHTNFDLGLHAPLMIHIPGRTDRGIVSDSIVEFTDIFPTIVEATGYGSLDRCPPTSQDILLCTEGTSFLKLLDDPRAKIRDFAFSQHRFRGQDMGYTVRTDRYRYTETVSLQHGQLANGYFQFRILWDRIIGLELYDHRKDPQENENVVADPGYSDVVKDLSDVLHAHFGSMVTNLTNHFGS